MKSIEKKGPPKARRGKYSAEERSVIGEKILDWIGGGDTLREFCRVPENPSYSQIYDWLDNDPAFQARFMRARAVGYDCMAEDCLRIANTPMVGEIVTDSEEGRTVRREDMLGHRKLQVETRLKLLAKFNPKKYGDRVALAGDDDAPIKIEANFDIFAEMLKNMTLRRQTDE